MKKQNTIVEERIDAAKNYIERNIKKTILRKNFYGKSYKKK